MPSFIKGRVWKFGNNIDTDVLAPWKSMDASWTERKGNILHVRPGFVDKVRSGDIIVAGHNWGCGSSREQAAENMKKLGLAAVVAESFGRIYFRNSIAIALLSLVCPGVSEAFEEHDVMEIDLENSRVRNLTRGTELVSKTYTADMLAIIEKGGLMNVLKERLSQG